MPRLKDAIAASQAEAEGKDPDFAKLEQLAKDLHDRGLDFTVEHGRVARVAKDTDRETALDLGTSHIRLGIVSDTHGGSKFEQLTALRSFYSYAIDTGVDVFLHAGDLTQGPDTMHPGMGLEVHAHGAEEQVRYVVATYPQSPVPTYVIGGNHDYSFAKAAGVNVVRQVAAQRPDIIHIGQDAAYLTIGNLRIYMVHPDGGGAYAKSYKPQKIAEALPLERRVALALIGHYHVYGSFREKRTHTLMLPCFQSQYGYLARKSLHPDIGGLIADLWLDDDGYLARISHEFIAYQRLENDWDHVASAEVSRGWTPDAGVAA